MSQTAAQINQEIIDRLNRGSEIGSSRVYDWMNRVKRRACTQAEPLDFMLHEALVLMGSGSAIPGDGSGLSGNHILLPYNFVALKQAAVLAGEFIASADLDRIFGGDVSPGLFTYPTTCSVSPYLSTSHAGAGDLYPHFGVPSSFIYEDLTARGVTFSLPNAAGDLRFCSILSPTVSPFMSSPAWQQSTIRCVVLANSTGLVSNASDVTSAMAAEGYADGPWPAKVFEINAEDYEDLAGEDAAFVSLLYYRVPVDYGVPSIESIGAMIPAGDIVTETAPDLLIEGSLELAWQYLNDDVRRQTHQLNAWGNPALGRPNGLAYEFRKVHRTSQIESGLVERRRLKEGTRVARF